MTALERAETGMLTDFVVVQVAGRVAMGRRFLFSPPGGTLGRLDDRFALL